MIQADGGWASEYAWGRELCSYVHIDLVPGLLQGNNRCCLLIGSLWLKLCGVASNGSTSGVDPLNSIVLRYGLGAQPAHPDRVDYIE